VSAPATGIGLATLAGYAVFKMAVSVSGAASATIQIGLRAEASASGQATATLSGQRLRSAAVSVTGAASVTLITIRGRTATGALIGVATAATVTYVTYHVGLAATGAASATLLTGFLKGGQALLTGGATGVMVGDLISSRSVGAVVKPSITSAATAATNYVRYSIAAVTSRGISN
jgi:hypothetical protein